MLSCRSWWWCRVTVESVTAKVRSDGMILLLRPKNAPAPKLLTYTERVRYCPRWSGTDDPALPTERSVSGHPCSHPLLLRARNVAPPTAASMCI